ncbi:MAG: AbrB/MazE/SpoVT family DNA-binding domain-containing protein [Peptococcaceae bacterium]|nr:AbrB/MazE/SpoVT family DNA-binding domain-containing protein [Peptococcaceae bacterium]
MNSVVAKLTSKGQLTLPKPVRDRLKLDKGSYIAIYLENNQIVMKKVDPQKPLSDADPIWDMAGMFHSGGGCEGRADSREGKTKSVREAVGWKPSL